MFEFSYVKDCACIGFVLCMLWVFGTYLLNTQYISIFWHDISIYATPVKLDCWFCYGYPFVSFYDGINNILVSRCIDRIRQEYC